MPNTTDLKVQTLTSTAYETDENGKKSAMSSERKKFLVDGKEVTGQEYEEALKKRNAPGKKRYLVNGKEATKEEYDAVVKKNEEMKNAKPGSQQKETVYQDESGKNISKEEYENIQKQNKATEKSNEEIKKAGPNKVYKVDGKTVSKEEYEAVQKKNQEIKNKRGL